MIVNLGTSAITVNGITVIGGTANDGMGGTDTLVNIEQARGSDFDDYLRGSDSATTREFFTGDAGNDTFDGGAGIDYASYGNAPLVFVGIDAFIENGSGFVNDKLGGGGTDTLISIENAEGSDFDDTLIGSNGANELLGRGGNDTIAGQAGADTAVFRGAHADYEIVQTGSGHTVSDKLGADGTDTLSGIERLRFSDTTIALDLGPAEAAGNTVRLIGAAFGKGHITPELVGIGVDVSDAGLSMLQVADLALRTPLYLSRANSNGNVDFVNTVYRNLIGSLPSEAGGCRKTGSRCSREVDAARAVARPRRIRRKCAPDTVE